MSREQDVKVTGRIVELVSPPVAGNGAVYLVDLEEQFGEHISGRRQLVTARRVHARASLKMTDSGVRVRMQDRVALLVNPWTNGESINKHVCVMIAVDHKSKR